ncbi:MAG TPA: hypothetical protein VE377_22585 [Candidatus Dormibacteraeota bacterium]|nr:hypothetical protein [Candidatus Dormibacteraeota bacterium]
MMRTAALLMLAASGSNQYTPTFPGGIVAWIVCNARKRNEFGGWLLYFYWQLYSGVIVTAIFFAINFQSYVPENFEHRATHYLFLASTVPVIVIFALQAAVATMLISVRTWDMLRLLRGLVAAAVIAAVASVAIDAKYFPDDLALGILMTLIPECIWLAYFFASKRVEHVFKTHDWDTAVEVIHPTTTKLVI